MKQITDQDFELNLLFEQAKNPLDAFQQISEVFQILNTFDKWVLTAIGRKITVEYTIADLEYASIKTLIEQTLKATPDEAIAELDWKKVIGAILLRAKYRLLKYLESHKRIDSREDIEIVPRQINEDFEASGLNKVTVISPLNLFPLVDLYSSAINAFNKLGEGENVEYKSSYGNARLGNGIVINRQKVITELSEDAIINTTTEILKIKKLDLLSDEASWDFKKDHRALKGVKISDHDWLNEYHSRKFVLLPEDSLKVRLKTTYIRSPDPEFSNTTYEILKVLEVITPSTNNGGGKLFE